MITNSNSDKKLLNKYIQTYKICNTLLEVVHENAFNFITFFRGEKVFTGAFLPRSFQKAPIQCIHSPV